MIAYVHCEPCDEQKEKDLIENTDYVPQHQIPKAEIMINGWQTFRRSEKMNGESYDIHNDCS